MKLAPDLVDERIKVSREPLHAQISALIEKMDRLIHSNSAKETTTASSRVTRHQYESPYNEVPGSSRFPTMTPLSTTGYSRDRESVDNAHNSQILSTFQEAHCLLKLVKVNKQVFARIY